MFPFSVNNLITFQKIISYKQCRVNNFFSILVFLHEHSRFQDSRGRGRYFFKVLFTNSTRFTDT